MSAALEHYREAFGRAESVLPGNQLEDVKQLRRGALEKFQRMGFPKPRDEDWKYTRVTAIEKRGFQLADGSAEVDATAFLLPESTSAHQLVFVDGVLRRDLSPGLDDRDGVRLGGLAEALAGDDPVSRSTAARLLGEPESAPSGFAALNTAFSGDGLVLSLEPGVKLTSPVHLLFLASGTDDAMAHPRILVHCAAGAQATVIEHYVSAADGAYFNNAVTRVQLAGNARLTHYKLQRESMKAFHVSRMDVHQEAGSRFVSHSVNLGAALARHDINVTLDAPGASCTLNGLYSGHGRQHVDYHTRVDHVAPECVSDEDYRGILGGRSRGVFNGRVYVHPDAQKTDATQSNRNLLLSRDAEVDTKPQLEIHANDVKCAHGATIGQLDARMIFYLRSRGIEEAAARALLTYGFARDLMERMDIDAVRDIVSESLLDRLPHAGELRSMLS